jgi:hypothetical protein
MCTDMLCNELSSGQVASVQVTRGPEAGPVQRLASAPGSLLATVTHG